MTPRGGIGSYGFHDGRFRCLDKSAFYLHICPLKHSALITRTLHSKIQALRSQFPVLTLTGPRQSGKTTLLRGVYSDLPYVTLEDIDNRLYATEDPRGFLANYPTGAVLDEVQRTPDLFSYLQGVVDRGGCHFALSGSENFQLSEKINQSLAGRTAVLKLLPFSFEELIPTPYAPPTWEKFVFSGGYPRIFDRNIRPADFYASYIATYVEKDVRQIKNIHDLTIFSSFLKLCAGRIGHVLNIQHLANDAGISPNTARLWLSVLQASYIIHFLPPYHVNFSKRLIKSPKLYFYDTGVACSLLGMDDESQLHSHYLKGSLFENFILNELLKHCLHTGSVPHLYFWMSKEKKEVDVLWERNTKRIPIEIKAGKTKNTHFFENLVYWQKLSGTPTEESFVVYGGEDTSRLPHGHLIGWQHLGQLIEATSTRAGELST